MNPQGPHKDSRLQVFGLFMRGLRGPPGYQGFRNLPHVMGVPARRHLDARDPSQSPTKAPTPLSSTPE
jgi:hypothetical protein